jgi:hypothetical protein
LKTKRERVNCSMKGAEIGSGKEKPGIAASKEGAKI